MPKKLKAIVKEIEKYDYKFNLKTGVGTMKKKPKWKPEEGERIYYISDFGVAKARWYKGANYEVMKDTIFRTRALALAAAKKIKELLTFLPHS